MAPKKAPLQSEAVYKKLVEHMNEGVWMGDKNEKTIYANPKFCEMMGYSLEEMLGKESYDFWDEESAKRVQYINQHHRSKGVSSSYEGNLLTKAGARVPVLLSGTPLPGGGTVGIITDLTELKKREQAEKVLSGAVEYATDAIVIFNNHGEITSWNKGAKITFGYKKTEMIGNRLEKIFPKEDIQALLSEASVLYNVEFKGIHRNGELINISATVTPIVSEDGEDAHFCLLIGRDVTNQKKFEDELAAKYQKMREAYNQFGVLRRQMDYLFDILELWRGYQDPKTVADFVVTSLIMLTRADACVLRIYNEKKDSLDLLSSFGVAEDWKGKASIKFKKSLAEKAFEKMEALRIIDVAQEPRYQSAFLARKNKLCSLLLIPLSFKTKPVGTLSLYVSASKKLEIFENEFIEKYARLVEIALGTLL